MSVSKKPVSNRVKKLARNRMAAQPGITYNQALDATRHVKPSDSPWIAALGGVPTAETLADRWTTVTTAEALRIPLGRDAANRETWINMNEELIPENPDGDGCHWAIAGRTGSGVTVTLRTMLLSLATLYGPDRAQFALLDFTGHGSLHQMEGLPHTVYTADHLRHDRQAAENACRWVSAELDARTHAFNAATEQGTIREYWDLVAAGTAPAVPELIVVAMGAEDPSMQEEYVHTMLHGVSACGRALGVHLILVGQHVPRGDYGDILDNLSGRFAMDLHASRDSITLIGVPDAVARRVGTGSGYLRTSARETPVPIAVFNSGDPQVVELRRVIESMPRYTYSLAEPNTHTS